MAQDTTSAIYLCWSCTSLPNHMDGCFTSEESTSWLHQQVSNVLCTLPFHHMVPQSGCFREQLNSDSWLHICRIWNHHRQECVLKRQLTDDPVDLSVHCSGLTILIAYSDKVQMLYILRYSCSLHSQLSTQACLHSPLIDHQSLAMWCRVCMAHDMLH